MSSPSVPPRQPPSGAVCSPSSVSPSQPGQRADAHACQIDRDGRRSRRASLRPGPSRLDPARRAHRPCHLRRGRLPLLAPRPRRDRAPPCERRHPRGSPARPCRSGHDGPRKRSRQRSWRHRADPPASLPIPRPKPNCRQARPSPASRRRMPQSQARRARGRPAGCDRWGPRRASACRNPRLQPAAAPCRPLAQRRCQERPACDHGRTLHAARPPDGPAEWRNSTGRPSVKATAMALRPRSWRNTAHRPFRDRMRFGRWPNPWLNVMLRIWVERFNHKVSGLQTRPCLIRVDLSFSR